MISYIGVIEQKTKQVELFYAFKGTAFALVTSILFAADLTQRSVKREIIHFKPFHTGIASESATFNRIDGAVLSALLK